MKKLVLLLLFVVATSATAVEKRFTVPLEDSPAIGPANAPVTLVEFIDFQ